MCGIAGFCDFQTDYIRYADYHREQLENMAQVQAHRGMRNSGTFLESHIGLSCTGYGQRKKERQIQPVLYTVFSFTWAIVFDGAIYNTAEMRKLLISRGWVFRTTGDAEVVLLSYLEYGRDFVKKLNGVFAFAIWDPCEEQLLLYRDRSGVKPLFYCRQGCRLLFSSEIKGILSQPDMKPKVDKQGLRELFGIGPARTCGCGVFQGIDEVLPGHINIFDEDGISQSCYWKLESHPHEDDYAVTVEKTTHLVLDAIRRQMTADTPVCTLLSGGLDSSLVSAVCASELRRQGERLTTYSFDFTDNDRYFKASAFQPSQDRPYVDQMVEYLGSDHKYLECTTQTQIDFLKQSVDAHDLPAMADVDSSLLYFCSQVRKESRIALTGECADEIFGGYPWFHKKECFEANTFPWTMDLNARKILLNDDFLEYLNLDEYVAMRYETSVRETPRLFGESDMEARRREIAYLNQKWFMQTLLNRMDRTSMSCGLEARVPFADHRIIEYLWNVPWDMKTKDGVVKGLLRECGKGFLPDEILYRRKSPYPKTYDAGYEILLAKKVRNLLEDSASPVLSFLDKKKVDAFLSAPADYGKPWYGQLMAGPQMLGYLWQVDYWLRKYAVEIVP